MAVLAHDLTGAGMIQERVRGQLFPEVFRDLASVEALWRSVESDPAALATPYQRFDWASAFVAAKLGCTASEQDKSLRIVVLRDAGGRPRVILPLQVARERGVRVARVIGCKHANYHMPMFASREAASMRAEDLVEILRRIGREAGIDVYLLGHQPRFWDGAANPLSLRAAPAASDAYGLILGPDPDTTAKRVFSADARKKMRSKEKKLIEAFGPVEYRVASTVEEVTSYLSAFFAQKASRFAAMDIANPYADEAIRRFIAAGACRHDDPSEVRGAAIEVSALVACNSGRVFATFAGAVSDVRYSGMMTSFDQDPVVGRSSPGDILLHHLIRDQTERGRRSFDLGVGEARYKANICDETIQLGEVTIAVTLRGHLFAIPAIAATRLKRRIKRSERLARLAKAVQKAVRRSTRQGQTAGEIKI
ncbi:GNAT family N-acetyltransferase [Methylobacterium sp. 77]|uniref:GNAT family N-acetyltransferase n=1 Tax=Methylobacterium sp. 77 TaxID=1101192 RepID=UPI00056A0E0B|nr:GNAT family N-acetyltransferase [Methylobacterium sp. 77]